jgi:hypothetical protein
LRIARDDDDSRFQLYEVFVFLKFRYLLTFGNQITINITRLGRVAKRLFERPEEALHPVAFFISLHDNKDYSIFFAIDKWKTLHYLNDRIIPSEITSLATLGSRSKGFFII